jgi:aminoglycoside phosphotransferase (APT) family kinase protein
MLTPADSDLVRRDPDLPGLGTVLDPEALADRLRRASGRDDLVSGPATYIKYQRGLSCLVGYELRIGQTVIPIHATAYRADASRKLDKARTRPEIRGALGAGRITLDDCVSLVTIFPNDRKIKALASLSQDETRQHLLAEVFPDWSEISAMTMRPMVYKPQLRYVACLQNGKEAAVLKSYCERDYGVAKKNAQALAPRDALRLPQLIGCLDRLAFLVMDWTAGRSLSEIICAASDETAVLEDVGAALASLHRQEPAGVPLLTRESEAAHLASVADAVGVLCPPLAARALRAAAKLGAAFVDLPEEDCPLHGDFYAAQVLISQQGVVILDLDAMVRGDPALDVGNFIAYLILENLRGKLSASRVANATESLVRGYRRCNPACRPDRIALYTAAGLLKRGLKPFRSRQREWPAATEALLARLEKVMANKTGET